TGRPAAPGDVRQVKQAVEIPVAIGSGLSPDNLAEYWNQADIFIIGSAFKHDGLWSNPPDPKRLQRLTEAAADLRG
ncbi:MAG: BtpA family membrane complex biogenesis protein, partial [Planctomycetes bacterium]|nr:BtpA family membrane complex biogenesis protein [Planctomycetota bacterium]